MINTSRWQNCGINQVLSGAHHTTLSLQFGRNKFYRKLDQFWNLPSQWWWCSSWTLFWWWWWWSPPLQILAFVAVHLLFKPFSDFPRATPWWRLWLQFIPQGNISVYIHHLMRMLNMMILLMAFVGHHLLFKPFPDFPRARPLILPWCGLWVWFWVWGRPLNT